MLAIVTYATAQKHYNFKLKKVNISSLDYTKVSFDFKIKNYRPEDKFELKIRAVDLSGNSYSISSAETFHFNGNDLNSKLSPMNLAGLESFPGGFNNIIWSPSNDGYKAIDDDLKFSFVLSKTSDVFIPYNRHLVKSIIFPGWGDIKLKKTKGPHHLLWGFVAYSALASSIYFDQEAKSNYNSYISSYNVEESNALFNDASRYKRMSRILAGLTAVTWTANLSWLYYHKESVKKDLKKSRFYYEMQNRTDSSNKNSPINTKELYVRYYDSALVDFKDEYFYQSRVKLLKSKTFSNKKDAVFQASVDSLLAIVETNIAYIRYQDTALTYYKKLDLENAYLYFNKANALIAEYSSNNTIIDSISTYIELINEGDSLFNAELFNDAITSYQKANLLYETAVIGEKLIYTNNEIKIRELTRNGDMSFSRREYNDALDYYNQALALKYDFGIVKKIDKTKNKININNQFQMYKHSAEGLLKRSEPEQALANYLKADSVSPNDPSVTMKINELNKFETICKNGDLYYKKNQYSSALKEYNQAINLFSSNRINQKIEEIQNIQYVSSLVKKADQLFLSKKYADSYDLYNQILAKNPNDSHSKSRLKSIERIYNNALADADKMFNIAVAQKSIAQYNKAIGKYESASQILPSELKPGIQISKCQQAIKEIKESQKKYADEVPVKNEQWIEIYNKNSLTIELQLIIENNSCDPNVTFSTIYNYRYNGYLTRSLSYANWSLEYKDCNGTKRIYTSGAPTGGNEIKNELGFGKLEDAIKEEFDESITNDGPIKSVFSFNVSYKKGN